MMLQSRLGLSTLRANRVFSARQFAATTKGSLPYAGNNVVGIVREEHGMWERRAPLTPAQVNELMKNVPGTRVLVQPCNRRVFGNSEYVNAGAEIAEDLSPASLILGVKQVKAPLLIEDKSYVFFSHTIKAQPYSMPLLDAILEKRVRLYDYECITKEGRDDQPRLVAFGAYAGRAGMVDGLQGLGLRLLAEGYNTPFLQVPNTYMHASLSESYESVRKVGEQIAAHGLPSELGPIIVAFTGSGNVAIGAREVFANLPHEYVKPEELATVREDVLAGRRPNNKIYAVHLTAQHLVAPKDPNAKFDKQDYYHNPDKYKPIFHENILPNITMLVNGIYWEPSYPRLVTNAQLAELRKTGNKNFRVLADVTCDIEGSVECLRQPSTIEDPFYTYNPENDTVNSTVTAEGVLVLGVDNLPSELPRDASEHFGKHLLPLLPPLIKSRGSATQEDMDDIPAEMRRACLTSHGKLMPKWQYIERLRAQASSSQNMKPSHHGSSVEIELSGHLFDTGLINHLLDTLETNKDVSFSVKRVDVKPNTPDGPQQSQIQLLLNGPSPAELNDTINQLNKLVDATPKAEASIRTSKFTESTPPKTVLLFGAGRVALPVMKLFNSRENMNVHIASDNANQAQELMNVMSPGRSSFTPFRFPEDLSRLPELMRNADVVVSLLPATMHVPLAEAAIDAGVNLVTASYVSPAMQALHEKAAAKGVVLMNEAGLDPGIDHMLIMRAIDSVQSRGGKVSELVSLCGGLPDPVAADNPLKYKFSWSPRGVLNAAGNSAQYLSKGKLIQIPGEQLLQSGSPSNRFSTMRLEVLPNRDSLQYRDLYRVPEVETICRGTLRYEGWSNVMYALRSLKLLTTTPVEGDSQPSVREHLKTLVGAKQVTVDNVKPLLEKAGVKDIPAAIEAIQWLGLLESSSDESIAFAEDCVGKSPIDALCTLLERRLEFDATEKDMVAMLHTVDATLPDGTREVHTSKLLAFGVPNSDTAMSATVGYTAAAAAEMLLDDKLKTYSDLTGVVIPTDPRVYEPILDRLQQFGITWTETVEKHRASK